MNSVKYINIPNKCPICGCDTIITKYNDTELLMCCNASCKGKLLGKLTHFVSKNAMNIDGLSKSTLEKFIDLGFVESFVDLYELKNNFYDDIVKLDGFGNRSVDSLVDAIDKSRNTTLDRFIYSLSIPLIGRNASKTISNYFNGDYDKFIETLNKTEFKWFSLPDFGQEMHLSIVEFKLNQYKTIEELAAYMTFQKKERIESDIDLSDMVFVITGSLNEFKNRDELKEKIESLGGKVSGSVSKKTSYLINNDSNSTSGKNKKANELGIPIITEKDFLKKFMNLLVI